MNYFEPSLERARVHRFEMDQLLWESVPEVLAGQQLDADLALPAGEASGSRTNFLDYAAYFDLSLGIPGGEPLTDAQKAFAASHLARRIGQIGDDAPEPRTPRVSRFDAATYSPGQLDQMHRWLDIEPANRMAMTDPNDEEVENAHRSIAMALRLFADAAPELHDETCTIIRDIVLTKPDGTNLINYSGASSFALWGALTINAETQREWMQCYRQIVHEAAHNLLFAIARDGQLLENDPSERAVSPIRDDARPLDGVFHAAFVSAREALAFDLMLSHHERTGCLEADDPQIIEDLLEISVLAFADCIPTLRAGSARLTELGDRVLADCEAYMNESFAIEAL